MQSTIELRPAPHPALHPLPQRLRLALFSLAAAMVLPAQAADGLPGDTPVTMPAVTVLGQSTAGTEGTQSYTAGEARSATRMELTLRETPQSVSVITRQLLDDLGAVRLDQALAQTTGIQVGQKDAGRTRF